MSWRRTALTLVFAACASGCGTRETAGGPRVWTLFDLASIAARGGRFAAGGSIVGGLRASAFVAPRADDGGAMVAGAPAGFELVEGHGFMDGLPTSYVSTEFWANVDTIWAQPLYRAIDASGAILEDPTVKEPWVFGVGPDSLFYSPFWEVFGFRVPPGTDVTTLLDTRAVLEAANQTGGLRRLEGRITSLAPANVRPPPARTEYIYLDDTAAWDGTGGRRYLDMGMGRFQYSADAVVQDFPLFIFTKRNSEGAFAPVDGWPTVGATRALFSAPPSVNGGGPATGGANGAAQRAIDPVFGGLWRLYTVELPDQAALDAAGRVVTDPSCFDPGGDPCVALDSQAAVEGLGAAAIHRTEYMASCPLTEWGDIGFPRGPQMQPLPLPTP